MRARRVNRPCPVGVLANSWFGRCSSDFRSQTTPDTFGQQLTSRTKPPQGCHAEPQAKVPPGARHNGYTWTARVATNDILYCALDDIAGLVATANVVGSASSASRRPMTRALQPPSSHTRTPPQQPPSMSCRAEGEGSPATRLRGSGAQVTEDDVARRERSLAMSGGHDIRGQRG